MLYGKEIFCKDAQLRIINVSGIEHVFSLRITLSSLLYLTFLVDQDHVSFISVVDAIFAKWLFTSIKIPY